MFDHFDMDGNGKIDSYELVCAMAMLSHSTLEVSYKVSKMLINTNNIF